SVRRQTVISLLERGTGAVGDEVVVNRLFLNIFERSRDREDKPVTLSRADFLRLLRAPKNRPVIRGILKGRLVSITGIPKDIPVHAMEAIEMPRIGTTYFGFDARGRLRFVTMMAGPEIEKKIRAPRSVSGTCFAVGPRQVVTAEHVVRDAKVVEIMFEGRRKERARVVRVDRKSDMALLETSRRTPARLPIKPARSLELGDEIFTIGFPNPKSLGWEPKYAEGTISALQSTRKGFLQTDLAIIPGNSGGAVVTRDGFAVGVVSSFQVSRSFVNSYRSSLIARLDRLGVRSRGRKRAPRAAVRLARKATCKIVVVKDRGEPTTASR
ncbi:MAG: serine protease, partial [Deltaproteobacteria bacterium]|nr:serine protease [Deltaproteobacteria bacterium]